MALTSALASATAKKNDGNTQYSSGNHTAALAAYAEAIAVLSNGDSPDVIITVADAANGAVREKYLPKLAGGNDDAESIEAAKLFSILFSNSSQVLLDVKKPSDAARFASTAAAFDSANVKAWVRLVRALSLDERHFAAFTALHLRLLPLLRSSSAIKPSERAAILDGMDVSVADAIGLQKLAPQFGVVDHQGGIGGVALANISEDSKLFVEKMAMSEFVKPDPEVILVSPTNPVVTHEKVLMHFAELLIKVYETPASWHSVLKLLEGSWPRRVEEVPLEVLVAAKEGFAKNFASFVEQRGDVAATEVVLCALVCRYNCFHAGFFRVCALLNHSCSPSVAMKHSPRDNEVHLVAVRNISAGEALTVKYLTDLEFLLGCGRRRELLHNSWLFYCDCKRCATECDPAVAHPAECVVCNHEGCTALVHLPIPGRDGFGADPLIPKSRKCHSCGHERRWDAAEIKHIYGIVDIATKPAEQHMSQLAAATVEYRRTALKFVGPQHWAIRVILFCYCSSLINVINKFWANFMNGHVVAADCAKDLLRHFGWGPRDDRNGGDVVLMFSELWALISEFYPPAQAWLLHVTICRLAVWSLMAPSNPASLAFDGAAGLFAKHAPYLTADERRVMLRKLTEGQPIDFTPKELSVLKKHLSK